MPIVSGNYVAPNWTNDQAPKLNAGNMQDISDTLVAAQVISGSAAPTTSTVAVVGQYYADTSTTPPTLYRCASVSGSTYTWELAVVQSTLNEYARTDGYYETLTAGNAEQLISTVRITDNAPYLFRTTGGSADVGNRSYPVLTGGTLVWNQLAQMSDTGWTRAGVTLSVSDGKLVVTLSSGAGNVHKAKINLTTNHVYAYYANGTKGDGDSKTANYGVSASSDNSSLTTQSETDGTYWRVYKPTVSAYFFIGKANSALAGETATFSAIQLVDLTLMLGATVADYIASLSNATARLAFFRQYGLFRRHDYAYDAGSLQSVCTSAHKTVGFNAFNPTSGTAQLVGAQQYQITGTYTSLSYADISGDAETITPDENGYFTPTYSGTLTVTGGTAADTCVHLVWSGEMDDEWDEYIEHTYPLDSSVILRGVPYLTSDNQLAYNGDTYEPDGTVTRYYGIRAYADGDENDSTVLTDGVNTQYALTTPTTASADPYTSPQVVDDFGTEEYVDALYAAGTRDVEIPVGHTTEYPANLRDKLQHLPDLADADGRYSIQQTGTQMSLTPDTAPGRLNALEAKLPDPPSTDGTYTLQVVVATVDEEQTATYSWVAAT